MIRYALTKDKHTCYGCCACEQACPVNAINMVLDEEGFKYPLVDFNLCIKCSKCSEICPYESEVKESQGKSYAIQIKDKIELLNSSSGGVFSLIANYVFEKNGYVCGCIFDEDLKAIHIVSNNKNDLIKMQGSKYVQSEISNIYERILELLCDEKLVLFSGTPCQVDGLKRFLGKSYQNLITIDLICHGVPSPKLLKKYLEFENKKGKRIEEIKFRDKKRNGWCSQGSIRSSNKIKNISSFNNSYFNLYYQNCVNRYSCYTCKYSSMKRVGDFTIGDCWNIEKYLLDIDLKTGYSTCFVNTSKGEIIFDKVKTNASIFDIDRNFLINNNGNLKEPSNMPKSRINIYKKIDEDGFENIIKENCNFQYIIPFIKKCIPRKLKKMIKRMRG
ncbi:MAG: Coenzyme F420 hydrogenase/dehydrogenase, beta subunit C-terminal domain [Bacilli bacterium]